MSAPARATSQRQNSLVSWQTLLGTVSPVNVSGGQIFYRRDTELSRLPRFVSSDFLLALNLIFRIGFRDTSFDF